MGSLEPQFPILFFGDGMQSLFVGLNDVKNDESGIEQVEITFMPSKELIEFYRLKDEDLINDNTLPYRYLRRSYPKSFFLMLNQDPRYSSVVILCDFHGLETPLTRYYSKILNINESYQVSFHQKKTECAVLRYKLKMATTNLGEYFRQFGEASVPLFKLRGQVNPNNEEKSYDGSVRSKYED